MRCNTELVTSAAIQAIEYDERRFTEEQRKKAEREEKEHRRFEEAVAATPAQIVCFHQQLDRYDTGVVHALMDNRQALDQAEDALTAIRDNASVLPDGRKVYRSEDGRHVFDDTGNPVGRDVIDPAAIPPAAPTWEQRQAAGQDVHNLTAERHGLLTYQAKVDQARERAGRDGVSQTELQGLGDDLDRAMPDAVRKRLDGPGQDSKLDGPQIVPSAIRLGLQGVEPT